MNNLHLRNRHNLLKSVFSEVVATGFRYIDTVGERTFEEQSNDHNYLIFLLEGEMLLNYNEYLNIRINPRELFFIPKSSEFSMRVLSHSSFVIAAFSLLELVFDKLSFNAYWNIASQSRHHFEPLSIDFAINDFLYSLIRYIRNGLNCTKMNELKIQELFLLLKRFYSKEIIANLFHPILGKLPGFKDKVMQNYQKVTNVDELAGLLGMGRTNFDIRFKKEFGMTPLQWMLKEKAKRVRFSMADPGVTLSDIMQKYNFNSPTHLNRFCKQQFGCSPSELMKKINDMDLNQVILW
ncbi:MAG: helix-turn-helix transcriptional regulator [Tannerellaceae bacterium]|jgi:AraC-like DNA-binding protein|nr:helix-turn-helix transcriptional regulator [Tannerellaceae bacterium]